jgi:hypothetical protein
MSYYGNSFQWGGPVRPRRNGLHDRNAAWRGQPMTDTQAAKIVKELGRRVIEPVVRDALLASVNSGVTRDGNPATKGSASDLIDWLLAKPYTSRTEVSTSVTKDDEPVRVEGFYRFTDGRVFRVMESQRNPGRYFAKVVTAHGWDYAGGRGMVYQLTAEMLMTPEQIAEFGVNSGICANCSRGLEDPISKHIGLGTKCGPAILGRDNYNAARRGAKLNPTVAEQLAAIQAGKDAQQAQADRFDVDEWARMKDEAARYEAEQERKAEIAKWEWKRSVENWDK